MLSNVYLSSSGLWTYTTSWDMTKWSCRMPGISGLNHAHIRSEGKGHALPFGGQLSGGLQLNGMPLHYPVSGLLRFLECRHQRLRVIQNRLSP